MIKKAITLCLSVLSLSVVLTSQQVPSPIREVFFIKSRTETPAIPPLIRIGVEMAANAYFKLSLEGTVVKAGLFPKGFNSFAVPTHSLIEKSGEVVYTLELRTESGVIQEEIVLDVRLEVTGIQKEAVQEIPTPEHRVSVYIDDELIASRKKTAEKTIPIKTKSPPLPPNYDPFKPDQSDNPMANSVSIFQVVGLAYHLIKGLTKKKDEGKRVPPIQKTQQITLNFVKRSPQGIEEQVRAEIRLKRGMSQA